MCVFILIYINYLKSTFRKVASKIILYSPFLLFDVHQILNMADTVVIIFFILYKGIYSYSFVLL